MFELNRINLTGFTINDPKEKFINEDGKPGLVTFCIKQKVWHMGKEEEQLINCKATGKVAERLLACGKDGKTRVVAKFTHLSIDGKLTAAPKTKDGKYYENVEVLVEDFGIIPKASKNKQQEEHVSAPTPAPVREEAPACVANGDIPF